MAIFPVQQPVTAKPFTCRMAAAILLLYAFAATESCRQPGMKRLRQEGFEREGHRRGWGWGLRPRGPRKAGWAEGARSPLAVRAASWHADEPYLIILISPRPKGGAFSCLPRTSYPRILPLQVRPSTARRPSHKRCLPRLARARGSFFRRQEPGRLLACCRRPCRSFSTRS